MDRKEMVHSVPGRPRNFRRRSDIERTNRDHLPGEFEVRNAIEAAGLGIFDYYPLNGELRWNGAAKAHFGLSPDAYVNYNLFLVGLHPRDRAGVDRLVQKALLRENDGKYAAEYRTIGIEDGKERRISSRGQAYFNAHGEAVRLVGTTLDVTESRMIEDNLRESGEYCRFLFEMSPLPKWVIDYETLSFLEVNNAAAELYGHTREEFRKLTLTGVRTPEECEKFRNRLKEHSSPGQTVEDPVLVRHRKKNLEEIDMLVQSTEIIYHGRRAILSVMIHPAL